jgi:hypothetical protein
MLLYLLLLLLLFVGQLPVLGKFVCYVINSNSVMIVSSINNNFVVISCSVIKNI